MELEWTDFRRSSSREKWSNILLHIFPKAGFSHAPPSQQRAAAKPALSWLCQFLTVLEASKVFELNILREISVEKKQTLSKQQQVTPCKAADS